MRATRRAKLAALVIGVLAVPTGLVAGTAGTASASAYCGKAVAQGGYERTVKMTAGVSANIRSGSSTSCAIVGWADHQDTLVYSCYTLGEGGTWTYLYDQSDDQLGWVKDSLLPYNGANTYCGF
ncbi:SH3 domain-containing protein [Streptomyces sp. NPDC005065]|uniref:SH3 domain-containing protein n=1 Tax=Streptomyces sp. NPDC005065 TaxID=3154461 RepID=UPI00339E5C9C